jgi:hypothetical protein
MNTEAEIAQAISDYRSGRLGKIPRGVRGGGMPPL